jgi:hypothetical protein
MVVTLYDFYTETKSNEIPSTEPRTAQNEWVKLLLYWGNSHLQLCMYIQEVLDWHFTFKSEALCFQDTLELKAILYRNPYCKTSLAFFLT